MTLFRAHDEEQRNIAVAQPEDRCQVWLNVAQHFIDCMLDSVVCQTPLRHGLEVQRRDPVAAASVISVRTVEDAARMDGANSLTIYFRIVLSGSKG